MSLKASQETQGEKLNSAESLGKAVRDKEGQAVHVHLDKQRTNDGRKLCTKFHINVLWG